MSSSNSAATKHYAVVCSVLKVSSTFQFVIKMVQFLSTKTKTLFVLTLNKNNERCKKKFNKIVVDTSER